MRPPGGPTVRRRRGDRSTNHTTLARRADNRSSAPPRSPTGLSRARASRDGVATLADPDCHDPEHGAARSGPLAARDRRGHRCESQFGPPPPPGAHRRTVGTHRRGHHPPRRDQAAIDRTRDRPRPARSRGRESRDPPRADDAAELRTAVIATHRDRRMPRKEKPCLVPARRGSMHRHRVRMKTPRPTARARPPLRPRFAAPPPPPPLLRWPRLSAAPRHPPRFPAPPPSPSAQSSPCRSPASATPILEQAPRRSSGASPPLSPSSCSRNRDGPAPSDGNRRAHQPQPGRPATNLRGRPNYGPQPAPARSSGGPP
ncbi:hypothetical protein SAMN02745121_06229 [Nannocystis exedens]|uniref:Uncharacterized protein n=1 Tax=Nannocystis exedens TaxID=54 RepID=A0A1I2ER61_9BACT|nr:hypothetical protein NAEX_06940 [Nannocystis exedens]SFE95309.1 hypothetical protein SAMN02745121_06229 [Nannocystis exedens]